MLNKMEQKFGRYALPNLTLYLIGLYVVGYILNFMGGSLLGYLCFSPELILKGQVWRLVTWIVFPPGSLNFLTLLMLFIFYQFGTILERSWGTFKYNVYILSGIIITVICAFIAYFVLPGFSMTLYYLSTYYICLSIFLAVAAFFPNMQVMLYFIIPIKFKYAAIIHVAFIAYSCVTAYRSGDMGTYVMIIASLINCVLVVYLVKNSHTTFAQRAKNTQRRRDYQQKVRSARQSTGYKSASGVVTKHKCAICGRTELDGDDLEFRFCSKCEGNYEYCQDHLFTHEHIKRG